MDLKGEDSTCGSKDTIDSRCDHPIEVITINQRDYIIRMKNDEHKNIVIRKQRELIDILTGELKRLRSNTQSLVVDMNGQFLTILAILKQQVIQTQQKPQNCNNIVQTMKKVREQVQQARQKIDRLQKQLQQNKSKVIQKPIFIERKIEKPVYVDRIVEKIVPQEIITQKIVYVDKPVEVVVEKIVQKVVEKPIFFQKPVHKEPPKVEYLEKIVYVDKPIEVQKIVQVPVQKIVEKIVYVDKPVFVTSPKRANQFQGPIFNSKK